jgi:hypothetical protein
VCMKFDYGLRLWFNRKSFMKVGLRVWLCGYKLSMSM